MVLQMTDLRFFFLQPNSWDIQLEGSLRNAIISRRWKNPRNMGPWNTVQGLRATVDPCEDQSCAETILRFTQLHAPRESRKTNTVWRGGKGPVTGSVWVSTTAWDIKWIQGLHRPLHSGARKGSLCPFQPRKYFYWAKKFHLFSLPKPKKEERKKSSANMQNEQKKFLSLIITSARRNELVTS